MDLVLRPVVEADLDGLFDMMRDAVAVQVAAFTPDDPDDRQAFDAHMDRIHRSPDCLQWAVSRDDRLVGSIGTYVLDGATEVTYWIERSCWGQGVAASAIALLLEEVQVRPLHARAASDNLASLRVLHKSGFRVVGTQVAYATARRAEIEETILRLDAPTTSP